MSLPRNTAANYLGRGWEAAMGLVFIPVYIHQLGVEAWGLVGFMTMLQAWLLVLDIGLSPTLSREMARFNAKSHSDESIRNLLRSLEVIYIGIALVSLTGMALASSWLANHWIKAEHLDNETIRRAIVLISVIIVSRLVSEVYRGAIQGLQKMVWLNAALAILATIRWGGAAVCLVWINNSIDTFFTWLAGVSLAMVLVLLIRTHSYLPGNFRQGKFDFTELIKIRKFAGGMFAISMLSVILTQVDSLILSNLLPLKIFGYYTLAATVSGGLLFLVSPVTTATYPKLTELFTQKKYKEFIQIYHKASQWIAIVLVPASLTLAIYSKQILLIWTGNGEVSTHAGELLQLLAIGTMLNGFMYMPYMAQLAYGWTGLTTRINVIAVTIIIPTLFIVVPRYGAMGAVWIWLALNVGYLVIGISLMHRKIMPFEKYGWYIRAVIIPLCIVTSVIAISKLSFPIQGRNINTILYLLLTWSLSQIAVAITTPVSIQYLKKKCNMQK